jgi:predicted transcriptional regulator
MSSVRVVARIRTYAGKKRNSETYSQIFSIINDSNVVSKCKQLRRQSRFRICIMQNTAVLDYLHVKSGSVIKGHYLEDISTHEGKVQPTIKVEISLNLERTYHLPRSYYQCYILH